MLVNINYLQNSKARLLCSAISAEHVFTSGIPQTQNGLSLRFRSCVLIPSSVCTLYFPSPSYTQDGVTPLYYASQGGYDGIVEQLILAGAMVDLQAKVGIATTLNYIALPQLPTYQAHVGTLLGGYGTAFEFVTITTSNRSHKTYRMPDLENQEW